MHRLVRVVSIMFCAAALLCVALAHTWASDIAVLESIIDDRQNQLTDQGTVEAAIRALGDIGSIDGAKVLLDNITYPRMNITLDEMLAGTVPAIDVEGGHWSVGSDGRFWLTSMAFPAVQALVKIGPDVIPLVLERLAEADFDFYRNAYLDVLIEFMDQGKAEALLKKEMAGAQSDEVAKRLQKSIDLLPDLRPMMGLYEPGRAAGPNVKPDSAIIAGRRKLLDTAKVNIPPLIVVNDLALPRGSIIVDGVTLSPAKELAGLLNAVCKQDSDRLVLFTTGAKPKTLVLYRDRRCALAGSRQISLPGAPVIRDKGMYIPLRAVAEYFGASVKWDPLPRVAWVHRSID